MKRRHLAIAAALALCAAGASAQRGLRGMLGDPVVVNAAYDGRFTFARLKYGVAPGGYYYREMPSWAHGYPNAEHNLLRITREISLFRPRVDTTNILAITDPALSAQGRLPDPRRQPRRTVSRQHGLGEHRGELSSHSAGVALRRTHDGAPDLSFVLRHHLVRRGETVL
jgi:hypothetical protein